MGKIEKHGSIFRCEVCGKFISYAELDANKADLKFVPDTFFSVERTLFTHKKCRT